MKLLRHLLPAALAATALASCAQPQPKPSAEPESRRLASELRALIGPASCTDDSQCRTLAVGAKACGGPAGYWAWSTTGTDAKQLTELASRQAEAQRRENRDSGVNSNCSMLMDPGAACVAQRCELASKAGAAAR